MAGGDHSFVPVGLEVIDADQADEDLYSYDRTLNIGGASAKREKEPLSKQP